MRAFKYTHMLDIRRHANGDVDPGLMDAVLHHCIRRTRWIAGQNAEIASVSTMLTPDIESDRVTLTVEILAGVPQ
jgi:hypothetical protein